jgi:hypothetical protein
MQLEEPTTSYSGRVTWMVYRDGLTIASSLAPGPPPVGMATRTR